MPLWKMSSLRLMRSMLSQGPQVRKQVVRSRRNRRESWRSSLCINAIFKLQKDYGCLQILLKQCLINLLWPYYLKHPAREIIIEMKQQCWKIRNLKQTPEVTLCKAQHRDAKRERHSRQELLVIQCAQCRLTLHRGYLPETRLRSGGSPVGVSVQELQRVISRNSQEGAILLCGKCRNKVAIIREAEAMAVTLQSLILHVPEGCTPYPFPHCQPREPYDALGAFTSLSFRKIMAELYRLAYTKQSRYHLMTQELGKKLKQFHERFRGLYNLIILNENIREKLARPQDPTPISTSLHHVEFDKMMRSTTIDNSNSRLRQSHSRSRKRQGASLALRK